MSEPRSVEEWEGYLDQWVTRPSTVSPRMMAEEIAQEADQRREVLENLYNVTLAFCHSIEEQLKHGRASMKAVALENAVRQVAIAALRRKE